MVRHDSLVIAYQPYSTSARVYIKTKQCGRDTLPAIVHSSSHLPHENPFFASFFLFCGFLGGGEIILMQLSKP